MREKSDKNKTKEGRGRITEAQYSAWRQAREAKSIGTASMIYDPIVGRTVHTLSENETKIFWVLRYKPQVIEIFEQFPLDKDEVTAICRSLGVPAYNHVLSTDFVVQMDGDRFVAISVKENRSEFDPGNPEYAKLVRRQAVEKIYWGKNYNIPFRILFGDDVSNVYANNIDNTMKFWDPRFVTNTTSKFKHLIAHGVIDIPLDDDYLRFGDLSRQYDVEELYEAYRKENEGNTHCQRKRLIVH